MDFSNFYTPGHQTCDVEVAPRSLGLVRLSPGDPPAAMKVFLPEVDARKECCICNSCQSCEKEVDVGVGGTSCPEGKRWGPPPSGAIMEATATPPPPPPHDHGSQQPSKPGPRIAVFSTMNQECISPGPDSSISVVGPLPVTPSFANAKGRQRQDLLPGPCARPSGASRFGPYSRFFLVLALVAAATSAAVASDQAERALDLVRQLPHQYVFLVPLFGLLHLGLPSFSVSSASSSHGKKKKKKKKDEVSSSSSTHPTSCTTCASADSFSMRSASRMKTTLAHILGVVVGTVLATAGLVALAVKLRKPPEPSFYERPGFYVALAALAAALTAVYMVTRPSELREQEAPASMPPPAPAKPQSGDSGAPNQSKRGEPTNKPEP